MPDNCAKRILIIEDELDLREALLSKMTSEGYRVETSETSEEGLKMVLTGNKPDLIILDVMTHSMHAVAFLQRLRDLPEGKNDSKVIVFTNTDNDITRNKVAAFNVSGYLIKSNTSLAELAEKVKVIFAEQL